MFTEIISATHTMARQHCDNVKELITLLQRCVIGFKFGIRSSAKESILVHKGNRLHGHMLNDRNTGFRLWSRERCSTLVGVIFDPRSLVHCTRHHTGSGEEGIGDGIG